jgi:hypothetical protein
LGDVFSAREIRQRAALVRRLRAELSEEQYAAVIAQIPRGYAEGFEAHDDRFRKGRSKLADNHPKRLRLLDRAESLPYDSFEELLRHTPKTAFTAGPPDVVPGYVVSRFSAHGHEARLAQAAAMMRLLRLLILLSLRGHRQYPVGVLLILLAALVNLVLASQEDSWLVAENRPVRASRPPGQGVCAEPCVARAPGRRGSLVAGRSEGRVGLCASRGNAVVT